MAAATFSLRSSAVLESPERQWRSKCRVEEGAIRFFFLLFFFSGWATFVMLLMMLMAERGNKIGSASGSTSSS